MSNYVIIPIDSDNPARPFVTGALTGTATGGGTVAGTGASAPQDVLGGSGSGAKATVTKGGDATIATATITISTVGVGYKEGDTVTIAVLGGGGATTWDAIINYTILAADLVVGDSQAEELLPVNDVACVDVVTDGLSIDVLLKQATAEKKYTLTLAGGSADNYEDIAIHVNNAIQKAMQAEHKQPVMTFPLGVSCYDVVLA